ncbi:winged helix-turn-helix domain-containing protein [Exiguobacterium marinum]|uniref:winged helix-turn-helix domain-containing protein n=1 Tax=Exiguobacterium marinum TaxID=273528 RepID=UPI00047E2160|nr:winged helix-turn-helix domain-containing protein [Exiguobacterium marinum]
MSNEKKEYGPGDTLVLRIRKNEHFLAEWAGKQTEIGESIRYLIENDISRNGMSDVSREIMKNRPELPTAKDIKTDLFMFIGDNEKVTPKEAYEYLADKYQLDDWSRTIITRSGKEPKWNNIVRWAKKDLQNEDLVESIEHGVWVLTDDGRYVHKRLSEDSQKKD